MSIKERFEIPSGFRMWSIGLMIAGALSLIIGYFVYGTGDEQHQIRFWAALLQEQCIFFTGGECRHVLFLRNYTGMGWF